MDTQGPKSASPEGALPIDVPKVALWSALVGNPSTSVVIASIEGQILYLNEQCVKMFIGPHAKIESYAGKYFRELFDPAWTEERLRVLRHVSETGKPVMLRTIWRGWQQLSWIQAIEPEVEEKTEDEWQPSALPPRFLITTRRVPGDDKAEELVKASTEVIESEVTDLGPLDVLSARELEVLALIGQGLSLKEIAKTLYRSVKTIDNHRQSIGKKLNVNDRVALAEIANRAGLTVADAERPRL
jgi:DNA-binding CsgD family transcriptional regulator